MSKKQNATEALHVNALQSFTGKRPTACLGCMLSLLLMAQLAQGEDIVSMGPYVQNGASTSMVIMWQTATPGGSHVAYWSDTLQMKFATAPEPVTQHEIRLENLEPDTLYTYLVLSSTEEIFESTFRTAMESERSFRFVVYGDSRTSPDDHRAVVTAIINNHPELVLHTGDLVAVGENRESWQPEFFDPAKDLMHHTPMFPILGNHEYWHSGRSWFFSFLSLPNNEQWFAFTYSNVRFIGLDTNVSFYPDSPQYRWLENELKSDVYQQSTWRIVYFHHPPFTASRYSDDPEIIHNLLPLFELGKVDMVFSGHAHAYERYAHHGIQYIVTGGGGTHLVPLSEDTAPPLRLVGESLLHHCVLDVNVPDRSLRFSVQENNGTVFDELILRKPVPDPNLPGDLTDDPNSGSSVSPQSTVQNQVSRTHRLL
jgi:predicted phosphohydrolase